MDFLERLRAYLESVARTPEGQPRPRIDVAAHRRHVLTVIDQLSTDPEHARELTGKWLQPSFATLIEKLAEGIEGDILAPDASQAEITATIDIAISRLLGVSSTTGSLARDAALDRITENAAVWAHYKRTSRDWVSPPPRYAFEIRAVRRRGGRTTLTPLGATLLDLPGSDAVRWLLAVESAQSLGPNDDWRVHPELARELLQAPERHFYVASDPEEPSFRYSRSSVHRLEALGLVRCSNFSWEEPHYDWGYTVQEPARPLLEEIAEQRATPFAVLADALLRDESSLALGRALPEPGLAAHESAAAANALQARMVVHEIRNALVPAEVALARLVRDAGEAAEVSKQRARVEAGIRRALRFVDEMMKVASLGAEPPAPFDVVSSLREVVAGMADELNGHLRFAPPTEGIVLVGPRARFALAVRNLLSNAGRAVAGRDGTVEMTIAPAEDAVTVHIDDNGPGVPEEQRRAIFAPGVALVSGGSGQGLALVRQVVEDEMGGAAVCSQSPLGGARFTITVPVKKSRTP
ncbi:sensor histidine kinase [Sorangium cellulosum]|uniref:sensor histidine kinase n=1 Tax=Sorangium cellulosum TaxID=56 RepID=UPI0012FFD19D|nr:HAMP domain-containing sensor histidine kinase [Sorangium cellulosum]